MIVTGAARNSSPATSLRPGAELEAVGFTVPSTDPLVNAVFGATWGHNLTKGLPDGTNSET